MTDLEIVNREYPSGIPRGRLRVPIEANPSAGESAGDLVALRIGGLIWSVRGGRPFSGAYGDLTGLPTLFSGAYGDLTGAPTDEEIAMAAFTNPPPLTAEQMTAVRVAIAAGTVKATRVADEAAYDALKNPDPLTIYYWL